MRYKQINTLGPTCSVSNCLANVIFPRGVHLRPVYINTQIFNALESISRGDQESPPTVMDLYIRIWEIFFGPVQFQIDVAICENYTSD